MKAVNFAKTALLVLLACMPAAAVKYLAVVETDVDAASGVSADINPAEVREITAELRRQATEHLPPDRYSVMTSETVQSMGGAVLEECAEENCVITLGSRIGADYIARGTISKFQTKLTLTVELFETDNGTLVVSSEAIRSENLEELLDKASAACANMYKKFVSAQRPAPPPPPDAEGAVAAAPAKPPAEPVKRAQMTGFTIAFSPGAHTRYGAYLSDGIRGDVYQEHLLFQAGIVHTRPITKRFLSLNVEGGIWTGWGGYDIDYVYYDIGGLSSNNDGNELFNNSFGFFGFYLPVTALFQFGFFSLEAGAHTDMVFGGGETLFNAGLTAGAGIGFSKTRARRYFYRYNSGSGFGSHVIGVWWLF